MGEGFDSEEMGRQLCVIGGILVAIGFVTLNGGSIYIGHQVQRQRTAENLQAREFVGMIKHEEQQFMDAAGALFSNRTPDALDLALVRVDALKAKCQSIRIATGNQGRLPGVLTTYGNAVRQWENGLLALKEKNPDKKYSQRLLDMGDQLRTDALADFNRYFVDHRSVAQRQ